MIGEVIEIKCHGPLLFRGNAYESPTVFLDILSSDSHHLKLTCQKLTPYYVTKISRYSRKLVRLRTVPTIITAHMFCASRDTRVSYGWSLLIQGILCYAEKAELSKRFWYRKRKLGITMHFSETLKLQFPK